jgi:hypothetical protein
METGYRSGYLGEADRTPPDEADRAPVAPSIDASRETVTVVEDPARPILLVDVDGVISLFGFAQHARPAGRFEMVDGIAHFLSATAGEHLRRLADAFEPVWCTGWEEKANEYLPHALGLDGPWPYLSFERNPGRSRAHWKLDAIDAYAAARPLAWIDDAHGEACEMWTAERVAPTLLVTTEPSVGMTEAEVAQLLVWAEELVRAAR